ncbi:Pectate lyase superfamily protein [Chitinispirillum alkaliphilum]|nr:Pectate lyase superfamily protein [Chitinispirillum alkaliphilum]
MKIKLYASFILTTILLTLSTTQADEVRAASGSRADIQAAIDAAPENGTVIIPEGNFNINGPSIRVNKNLTISGSGDNGTTLRGNSSLNWIFNVVTEGFFRLTNLVLDGNGAGGGVQLRSNDLTFRVDNSTFTNFRRRGVQTHGFVRGVIDNNRFLENGMTDVVIYGDNDASWDRPLSLGSDDAVYVEDNYFSHHRARNIHSIAANRGARYVFRYNTIDNGNQNTNPIDAHGNYEYGRGTRSYEIYGNTIKSGHSFMGMFIRGGTGVIFDNEFEGSFTQPIMLENYRSFMRGPNGRYLSSSYPGIDQIHDLHIWNNTVNGQETAVPFVRDRGLSREHIQENRDYFLRPNRNYTPYTYPHPLAQTDNPQALRSSRAASASAARAKSSVNASRTPQRTHPMVQEDDNGRSGSFSFDNMWERLLKATNISN